MRFPSLAILVASAALLAACDWTEPDTCGHGTRSVTIDQNVPCLDLSLDAMDRLVGTNGCTTSVTMSIAGSNQTFAAGAPIAAPIPKSLWVDAGGSGTALVQAMLGAQALVITATKCLA
jgi:hypothetical protein